MSERLTWEEICEKYPNQWLGLNNVEHGEFGSVISAVVTHVGLSYKDLCKKHIHKECFMVATSEELDDHMKYFVNERLTWSEIRRKYPNQWIGLTDVIPIENTLYGVKEATVRYVGMPYEQLRNREFFYDDNEPYPTSESVIEHIGGIFVI